MKVLVQGAGIAGCSVALALARQHFDVTVVEKRSQIFTDGAGIVLYSNALKCLDEIGVLENILKTGVSMQGRTEIWDYNSSLIGIVNYPTVDIKYPSYVGINRKSFLKILYEGAVASGVKFLFGTTTDATTINGDSKESVVFSNGTRSNYDLVIAADGTNSTLRNHLFDDQQSVFTNYGLWHSLHKRRESVNEKITVIGKSCKLGLVPLSDDTMYVWASKPEHEKVYIEKDLQPRVMKETFSSFTGLIGEIVDEIDNDTYVHYTAVEEVHLPKPWFKGNVVFIGDSAHASLPFMAQGGAQGLQDSVSLAQILIRSNSLDENLNAYTNFRFNVAKLVQDTSSRIGNNYRVDSPFDIIAAQKGADAFYRNLNNFKLPREQ